MSFTPLTSTRMNKLMAKERQGTTIQRPKAMTSKNKRNMNKFCQFHWDHRHDTEDCFMLRKYIKSLIKQGHLQCYLRMLSPKARERREEEWKGEDEDYDSD